MLHIRLSPRNSNSSCYCSRLTKHTHNMHVGVGLSGGADAKGTDPSMPWFTCFRSTLKWSCFVCCRRKRGHSLNNLLHRFDVLGFLFTAGVAKNHSKYLYPFQAKAREKHERHQFLGMSSYDKFHELVNLVTYLSWSQILTSLNEPVLDTHCCDIKKAILAIRLAGLCWFNVVSLIYYRSNMYHQELKLILLLQVLMFNTFIYSGVTPQGAPKMTRKERKKASIARQWQLPAWSSLLWAGGCTL